MNKYDLINFFGIFLLLSFFSIFVLFFLILIRKPEKHYKNDPKISYYSMISNMITLQTEYWVYKPRIIPSFVFPALYETIKPYCQRGYNKNRVSCWFDNIQNLPDNPKRNIGYGILPYYDWSEDAHPILVEICRLVEQYTKEKYDYVLIHIYPDGNTGIGYHFDTEATESSVASVSLGASRKFRFRKMGTTKGWETELRLNDGDLVWMKGPSGDRLSCQRVYQHTVPVEKTVKEPRINLTFRQYQ